jgi:hypothetical protein
MQANPFSQRGRALEEMYFRKREEENLRRRRRALKRQKLGSKMQVDDSDLLDSLIELGVTPENAAAFDFAPLIQTLWVNGQPDEEDRNVILDFAESFGLEPGGPAFTQLDSWLSQRPSQALFEAWCTLTEMGLMGRELGQRSRRRWSATHALAVARSRKARGSGSKHLRRTAQRIEAAMRDYAKKKAAPEAQAVA